MTSTETTETDAAETPQTQPDPAVAQNTTSDATQDATHDATQNTTQNTTDGTSPESGLAPADAPVAGHDPSGHNHSHAPQQPSMNPELLREITVTADAETVTKAFRGVIKKYQRAARIPGFRIGKVPETVIKSRFGKELRQEVLDELVSARFRQAIDEQGLKPVSQPQLTGLMLQEGAPLEFKAAFEVNPTLDLAGYETLTVPRPDIALTEAEYKAELDRVLEPHGTVETIEDDRPMADGDWAEIEFKGVMQPLATVVGDPAEKPEDDESEAITGEDILIEVGGANTLPAFSNALRGARPGQEMSFEVTYPADFGEARLAGQTVKYDVTVKGMKSKTFPAHDAEFARQMGDFDSWEAFEADLRQHTARRKQEALESQAKDRLLGEILDRYPFPVPETFVQQQIDMRLDRGLRALAQQGMSADDMRKLDFQRLREAQRDQAVAEVRASLVLDRIAELEQIQVDDEEVQREIMVASIQAREPFQTTHTRMTEDGTATRIQEQLRREKTGAALFARQAV